MPHRKKKKFIDKKNAVTFRLVHRSQKDPLQASDEVGQRVLLPVVDKDLEKQKEEQREFGVFYDDEYDYLQHLKDVNETMELEAIDTFRISQDQLPPKQPVASGEQKLNLPSTVFASSIETEVGLLNKAAPVSGPRLDWDPDIVAALDDDFDYDDPENALDDDFVAKANTGEGAIQEGEEGEWTDDDDVASYEAEMSGEAMDDEDRFGGDMFADEETKSRFTQYSMTSSVIRRTDGLTLLDDRFEKRKMLISPPRKTYKKIDLKPLQLYEQYDESEIGALDHEDIDGRVEPSSQILDSVLEEFEKDQAKIKLSDVVEGSVAPDDVESESEEEADATEMVKMEIEEPKEKWDCESILSTYSNLYNHPTLISEPGTKSTKNKDIHLSTKLGIPLEGLEKPGLTRKQIEKELHESLKADRAGTYRPRGETTEEKRARKQAIKEERKDRRVEKKNNKIAFGKEKLRQEKEQSNVRLNLQGVKML